MCLAGPCDLLDARLVTRRKDTPPGGPCMHATSGDSSENCTASLWLAFKEESKKFKSTAGTFAEGVAIPSSTCISRC